MPQQYLISESNVTVRSLLVNVTYDILFVGFTQDMRNFVKRINLQFLLRSSIIDSTLKLYGCEIYQEVDRNVCFSMNY